MACPLSLLSRSLGSRPATRAMRDTARVGWLDFISVYEHIQHKSSVPIQKSVLSLSSCLHNMMWSLFYNLLTNVISLLGLCCFLEQLFCFSDDFLEKKTRIQISLSSVHHVRFRRFLNNVSDCVYLDGYQRHSKVRHFNTLLKIKLVY